MYWNSILILIQLIHLFPRYHLLLSILFTLATCSCFATPNLKRIVACQSRVAFLSFVCTTLFMKFIWIIRSIHLCFKENLILVNKILSDKIFWPKEIKFSRLQYVCSLFVFFFCSVLFIGLSWTYLFKFHLDKGLCSKI